MKWISRYEFLNKKICSFNCFCEWYRFATKFKRDRRAARFDKTIDSLHQLDHFPRKENDLPF